MAAIDITQNKSNMFLLSIVLYFGCQPAPKNESKSVTQAISVETRQAEMLKEKPSESKANPPPAKAPSPPPAKAPSPPPTKAPSPPPAKAPSPPPAKAPPPPSPEAESPPKPAHGINGPQKELDSAKKPTGAPKLGLNTAQKPKSFDSDPNLDAKLPASQPSAVPGKTNMAQFDPTADGQSAPGMKLTAMILWKTMSIETYMKKVDEIVQNHDRYFKERDTKVPLVVVLGSSSSGGQSSIQTKGMSFWPKLVQKEFPSVHVRSIAWGGATTWHMKKALKKLQIRPDICILYMGHNDVMSKSPRQTLASLEKGEEPKSKNFVQWVSYSEAKQNVEEMSDICTHFLGMQEFRDGNVHNSTEDYITALKMSQGVTYADPMTVFSKHEKEKILSDQIHLHQFGHQVLAEFVIEKINPWIDSLDNKRDQK